MSVHAHEHIETSLRARDVVAFGQEYGRVLSDGQIVGRPEPFAKVFPSSREVKRAVGVTAWAILEDIALDARLDAEGLLVADTNVRRIAENLGLATNTVAKHLGRLRGHGFVLHEEQRANDSGQYATSRYVLDPSACLERFTHTPTTDPQPERDPESVHRPVTTVGIVDRAESGTDTSFSPCTKNCDTGGATVSQVLRHRDLRHNNKEVVVVVRRQQQQTGASETMADGPASPSAAQRTTAPLTSLGIPIARAAKLVAEHDPTRLREVVAAAAADEVRNPAGWVVAALTRGWAVQPGPRPDRRPQPRLVDPPSVPAGAEPDDTNHAPGSGPRDLQTQRGSAWAAAAASLLDDRQLASFAAVETDGPLAGFTVSGPRLLRARIASRLAAIHIAMPDLSLPDAIAHVFPGPARPGAIDLAMAALAGLELPSRLPACPYKPADADVVGLDARLLLISEMTRP